MVDIAAAAEGAPCDPRELLVCKDLEESIDITDRGGGAAVRGRERQRSTIWIHIHVLLYTYS